MAIAYTDYLQQAVGNAISVWSGVWVRLVSNNTGTAYISDAVTSSLGKFTFATKPPGDTYTVYTGPTNTGPWVSTGDVSYAVPVVQGENPSFQSETTQASGPYGSFLPGAPSVATPGGVTTGKIYDYGGQVWNILSFGAVGDCVWITDAAITGGLAVVTSPSNGLKDPSGAVLKAGAIVIVAGAGASGHELVSTVLASPAPTAGSVTLAANATGTVSGANACFGTDNAAIIQAAINKQQTLGGRVKVAAGSAGSKYLCANLGFAYGLIACPGSAGAFSDATRPCLIEGDGPDTALVVGQHFGADGLFGYVNAKVQAQLVVSDLTLDGNYVGQQGGVLNFYSNQAALVSVPWPFQSVASDAYNGQYHQWTRVRFYRPSAFVFQGTHGHVIDRCIFDRVGQPEQGVSNFDALGSSQGDALVKDSIWLNSTANYVDFVDGTGGAGHRLCVIFTGNQSYNHGQGGIYACGQGSIIEGNHLRNTTPGSGIGYDAGTNANMKANNRVAHNVFENMTVNASGLSAASYGDSIWDNATADSPQSSYLPAPIIIIPSSGVAAAASSYGSMPIKIDERTPSNVGNVTFNPLPTVFRHLLIEWDNITSLRVAVSDQLYMRFNGDAGSNYDTESLIVTGATATAAEALGQSLMLLADIPGTTSTANYTGSGQAWVKGYASATALKFMKAESVYAQSNLTTVAVPFSIRVGKWRTVNTAITQILIGGANANFSGRVTLYGIP